MTREQILNSFAEFTWNFGQHFYVKINGLGNFIWSDPDYNGDNSFKQTKLSYSQWIKPNFGRDKGRNLISAYCGRDIKIFDLNGKEVK